MFLVLYLVCFGGFKTGKAISSDRPPGPDPIKWYRNMTTRSQKQPEAVPLDLSRPH